MSRFIAIAKYNIKVENNNNRHRHITVVLSSYYKYKIMESTADMNYAKLFSDKVKQVDGIKVNVSQHLNHIPLSGFKFDMPVLFDVVTGEIMEKNEREPINLCITLDTSGSMDDDDRLEECKKAIKVLFNKLQHNDVIHLLTYSDTFKVVFTNKNNSDVPELNKMVDNITTDGTTNISGGLELSRNLLLSSDSPHKKIIFLFSDGVANVGIKDVDELGDLIVNWNKNDNICFSTFGIGHDFNERLMRGVARAGRGQYNYLDHPEKAVSYIRKALFCATSNIAENAKLCVRGLDGFFVKSINGDSSFNTLAYGKNIGSLNEKNIIQLLVYIEYDPSKLKNHYSTPMLEYSLYFDTKLDADLQSPITEIIHTSGTTDMSELCTMNNVDAYFALQKASELEQQIIEKVNNNDYEGAVKLKETVLKLYEENQGKDEYYIMNTMYANTVESLRELKTEKLSANVIKKQNFYGNMACAMAGQSAQTDRFACEEEVDGLEGGMDMFGGGGAGDY